MVNTKKLQKLMEKAANLALAHTEAVREAQMEFERVFGESIPEESKDFATLKEEAGSLFNNFTHYGENTAIVNHEFLAKYISELMKAES